MSFIAFEWNPHTVDLNKEMNAEVCATLHIASISGHRTTCHDHMPNMACKEDS